MTKTTTRTLRSLIATAAIGFGLTVFATASHAYSSEQRAACTPDAFRLCSSEIPNIPGITACMRRQKSQLSPACKAVFDK